MDLITELRRARSSPRTILGRLLTDYKPKGQTVHAFFEGQEDASFYLNFLTHFLPNNYQLFTYRCNNKNNVYEVHSRFDRATYESRRLLFFVDKDYSVLLGEAWTVDSNIFVTEHYSIENYLVTETILCRYLRDILHLDEYVEDEELLVRQFNEQLKQFYSLTLTIFAWIIFVKRAGLRPLLNEIRLSRLYKVTDDLRIVIHGRQKQSLLESLEEATGVITPPNSWKQIRAVANELKNTYPPKQYVRGKFELWFFVEFMSKIPELLNSIKGAGTRRIIVKTNINHGNAIEILGPRLQVPHDLEKFLESHKVKLTV